MATYSNAAPKDAAIPAVINALINGVIAYKSHADRDAVPLTVDAISSAEPTVGSEAAMIALTLAVILTSITALLERRRLAQRQPGRAVAPFFPTVPWLALQNALMLFGATVVAAVLWQRAAGTVSVSPVTAAMLVAAFAGAVTVVVHIRTTAAMFRAALRFGDG
jgi:hypothetical protein